MSTNRYIDKLKARLANETDRRVQLQWLLDDQVARNHALRAERDRLRDALEGIVAASWSGSETATDFAISQSKSFLISKMKELARAALQGEQL